MISTMIDDKAVDLYVLERAFISTHPGSENIVSVCASEFLVCVSSIHDCCVPHIPPVPAVSTDSHWTSNVLHMHR